LVTAKDTHVNARNSEFDGVLEREKEVIRRDVRESGHGPLLLQPSP
jgi:hypothetical protein